MEALLLTPKGNDVWEILVNPGRKALPGQEIEFSENFSCTVIDKTEFGGRLVSFIIPVILIIGWISWEKCRRRLISIKSWRIKMNTRRYMRSLRALPPHRQQGFILRKNLLQKVKDMGSRYRKK